MKVLLFDATHLAGLLGRTPERVRQLIRTGIIRPTGVGANGHAFFSGRAVARIVKRELARREMRRGRNMTSSAP